MQLQLQLTPSRLVVALFLSDSAVVHHLRSVHMSCNYYFCLLITRLTRLKPPLYSKQTNRWSESMTEREHSRGFAVSDIETGLELLQYAPENGGCSKIAVPLLQ